MYTRNPYPFHNIPAPSVNDAYCNKARIVLAQLRLPKRTIRQRMVAWLRGR